MYRTRELLTVFQCDHFTTSTNFRTQRAEPFIYVVSYTPTLLALRVTLYSYEPFDYDLYLEGGGGKFRDTMGCLS